MTCGFKNIPLAPRALGDGLIATALDGVVYIENSRLHIKGNAAHYVYKPEGSPVGWYARNIKTCDDNFHDLAQKPSDVENKYTLAYANLVPFLIGAIKELNAKIKALEGK